MSPVVTHRPTLKDVAKAADVHISTASRALNVATRSVVNAATVTRVLDAANRLGYQPHPLARGLRTNRTMSVGVVIPDMENPLFGPIVAGIEAGLASDGYSVLITTAAAGVEQEAAAVESLMNRQVDGLILATATRRDPLVAGLADDGIPLVLVNRLAEDADVPAIVGDDARGIELVVDHLIELGHTAIGHIAGPDDMSTGRGRRLAFERAVRGHGLKVVVERCGAFKVEPGAAGTDRLLEREPDTTAIVAANDLLGLGAYRSILARGRSIGTDVSVTGYNDMNLLDLMQPPMTAIHVAYRNMGSRAADLLLEIIAGNDQASTIRLEPTLHIRESTQPARG